ncbi:MAG: tetratricopeptide repeat protein [Spirochaetaceae bacterium]|jgi:tetratricopeptide (TPR) repeat protein|nr:tetratricopeptide repeat protein [Spirochaetaceae bacterium]
MDKMAEAEKEIRSGGDWRSELYGFFQKNRRKILVSLVAALVLLAGFIVAQVARDAALKDASAKLDVLVERYDGIINALTADGPADVPDLLDGLEAFGKSASGYPAARAWFMAANIYHERKEWERAREAWLAAAKKGAATHLAPVSLFNAAAAAEEAGDPDAALETYKKALAFADFASAAHAQFATGRLEEKKGNTEAAIAAYQSVIDKWPQDTDWTNLAHSRIIALELGKTE